MTDLRQPRLNSRSASPEDPLRGLGLRSKAVLLYVLKYGPSTRSEIGRAMGLRAPLIADACYALVGRGLVREKKVAYRNTYQIKVCAI